MIALNALQLPVAGGSPQIRVTALAESDDWGVTKSRSRRHVSV